MRNVIYLDYQATTPAEPEVLDAMMGAYRHSFGNPASRHYLGLVAEGEVETARRTVSAYLEVLPSSIYFTGGATEANNLAIKGIARGYGRGHVITVATEHKSVLAPVHRLKREGFDVTFLAVRRDGSIDLDKLRATVREDTVLGSFMLVNNEIGTIHPLADIAAILHECGALVHCDATQGLPNLRFSPKRLGIDLMSCSGHKIYGPKGVGALHVDHERVDMERLLPELEGGSQERGVRAGTMNVPAVVGFAKAVELLGVRLKSDIAENREKRRRFLETLPKELRFTVNGPAEDGAPCNLSLTFQGLTASKILSALDHVMIGTGSACNANSAFTSHVLEAIGLTEEERGSTVRISFGRWTALAEVEQAAAAFAVLVPPVH